MENTTTQKKKRRNNRTAGHGYELECAQQLRDIGFEHVVTSRSESRSRDAEKIDLINRDEGKNGRLPYNIQCKNSCQLIKYNEILTRGRGKTVTPKAGGRKVIYVPPMPKVDGVINVIFHKYTSNKGTGNSSGRFVTRGEFAILCKDDFLAMAKELEELKAMKRLQEERRNTIIKRADNPAQRPLTPTECTAVKPNT